MSLISNLFGKLSKVLPLPEQGARSLMTESRYTVHVSDTDVRCERPDGRVECVTWGDLQAVSIRTTDEGPSQPDVFWILEGADASSGCVIPQGATGESFLIECLHQLPGFDNAAVIRAMSSTDDEEFPCWQRAVASTDVDFSSAA